MHFLVRKPYVQSGKLTGKIQVEKHAFLTNKETHSESFPPPFVAVQQPQPSSVRSHLRSLPIHLQKDAQCKILLEMHCMVRQPPTEQEYSFGRKAKQQNLNKPRNKSGKKTILNELLNMLILYTTVFHAVRRILGVKDQRS